ncbi:MAG: FAD-linked oxidase C-terminal domain-containing protein [Spirosomataceae bacterium]
MKPTHSDFESLQRKFSGELFFDESAAHQALRMVYATDASVYQEKPLGVAIPRDKQDIKSLIRFAQKHRVTLIPRAAGTSLAGQVVGNGLVVDTSKYFNKVLEINVEEKWVSIQPGYIRDDLNVYLHPYGLMFGPETSTSSRAMIGGMVGNNSCGLHSIVWGTTRDHLLEATVLLSDGSEAVFKNLTNQEFERKCLENPAKPSFENQIYRQLYNLLFSTKHQEEIKAAFPNPAITRRNTGYALDFLLDMEPFSQGGTSFNLCKLLAGSEGTLAMVTELKLNLLDLPPKAVGLLCVHCKSVIESTRANVIAMRHKPHASELVDKFIMDFTKDHPEYRKNRFFIEGDPKAILMVEFFAETRLKVEQKAAKLVEELRAEELGFAYPLLFDDDSKKAWDVRKAGLSLLRNQPGDAKPVNLIEDCAVTVEDLPNYVNDLQRLLGNHGLQASFYAHAGAGELHVEPMINLKKAGGKEQFKQVLADTVELVKKYNGSLSGEHGDGRLRGEFIPTMMGKAVYQLFREVKEIFDPNYIFNAGKIVDTPPMNEFLRYSPEKAHVEVDTLFDFSKTKGIVGLTEKCEGSGDCRKTELTGGTMCPSFMATRKEKDTTRARANILRQFLTNSEKENPFDHAEIKEVMDLCLSCKGCKTECPSSVDVAKLKAEFLQHYYDANGVPFRTKMIGNFTKMSELASRMPRTYNFLMSNPLTSSVAKGVMGFAQKRSIPLLHTTTLRQWFKQRKSTTKATSKKRRIFLFADEFTNYNDVEIGIKFVELFERLGYQVEIPNHVESGRTYLSKGLVREARQLAIQNVKLLYEQVYDGTPIIGIEPSAILTLRDEYLELVPDTLRPNAEKLAENVYLFDEFFAQEIDKKNIKSNQFIKEKRLVKLHGHCHQKALSSLVPSKKSLSVPENYEVQLIPSGCCGMAGSFGYEKEHYDVSMAVGELVLFPTIRQQPAEVLIAAPGTSCRHQIKDGTGRTSQHPIEILWDALLP